ncbi:unnamed protein product [Sphenostylis stenocarpa]|uniref:Uncharacterized protein n=1 Tax=Sphenostylis stenocarpa TaxID=92480 RepID=A0AA86SQ71_9FABA|nr:unnamed protein product [Sphenostylis stenocarpa]
MVAAGLGRSVVSLVEATTMATNTGLMLGVGYDGGGTTGTRGGWRGEEKVDGGALCDGSMEVVTCAVRGWRWIMREVLIRVEGE